VDRRGGGGGLVGLVQWLVVQRTSVSEIGIGFVNGNGFGDRGSAEPETDPFTGLLLTVQAAVVRRRSAVLQVASGPTMIVPGAGRRGGPRAGHLGPSTELAVQLRGFGRVQAQGFHA